MFVSVSRGRGDRLFAPGIEKGSLGMGVKVCCMVV